MTFSINHLGNNGHLGNQMFQYAFVKAMAKKYNTDFCIPPNEIFGKYYYQKLFSNIDEAFDIDCRREIGPYPDVNERFFHYDEELVEGITQKDVNFIGFFQSETYFKNIEDEIRKDFTFKKEIREDCQDIVEEYKGNISVHIRRNDFLRNPNHPVQPNQYYIDALKEFPEDIPVLVFTDDIEWAKQQEMFSDDRFVISETDNAYYDLYIMSKCSYHVICNSTYSWWGAWLANSQNVIAPKNWFAGDCIGHDTKDMYLPHWKLL
tara:strand:- start:693 stop:1481 length:789 start_codon:yes stop_codon:yes gene_type:complete